MVRSGGGTYLLLEERRMVEDIFCLGLKNIFIYQGRRGDKKKDVHHFTSITLKNRYPLGQALPTKPSF